MVLAYIKVLLATTKCKQQLSEYDIGVVTPYKRQADEIKAKCEMECINDITIGTAAVLQGQEKQIIIISTASVGNVSNFAANSRVISFIFSFQTFCMKLYFSHISADKRHADPGKESSSFNWT